VSSVLWCFGGKALVDLGKSGSEAVAARLCGGNGFSRGDERLILNPLLVCEGQVALHEWVNDEYICVIKIVKRRGKNNWTIEEGR